MTLGKVLQGYTYTHPSPFGTDNVRMSSKYYFYCSMLELQEGETNVVCTEVGVPYQCTP